ncbi:MBOAT family protein [Romeria aff. gracilis LEGE 07310]|uniref:MBOAT family protein n=1 Tax=Vasconcelosia minhoensis LEGE 07310 TaxID=915328 RepID=A0A8J7AUY3_9CYAN|nr:MBOAT family protein [Romeria gracilis]MBE9075927.1 MBOAT family protein [Romeria aff. gracilis LEGE 07310]
MNFSEFSFWWVLLLTSVPFFTARYVSRSLNLWRSSFDTVGLAALSLFLFSNASRTSFAVFGFEILFNYLMVKWMLSRQGWQARAIATALIVFDIGVLAYFKYLTFFIEDMVGLATGGAPENWQASFPLPIFRQIPPGVSFYTFQMVAFVVDSFKARRKKPIRFIDYINFVSFFPQIVAGPIERRSALLPQLEAFQFKFTLENLDLGLRWLSLGLFMKFVLADNIAPYIQLEEMGNPWLVWFYAFLFTLRIYFDFAGYSFIALGIAQIIGVRLTVNFLAPYTSQSINEFWRRWHVSLSTWFRDYVFLPLMGKRKQWAAFFLFITFTLSGFWHGAAWNFMIWGAYHGALLLLLRYAGRPFSRLIGQYVKRPQFISWALTFGAVILGCLFFMETDTGRLVAKLRTLVTPWAYSPANLLGAFSIFSVNEGVALGLVLLLAIAFLLLEHVAVWQERPSEYELLTSPWMSKLLLGLTILLAANLPSEFIYFDF